MRRVALAFVVLLGSALSVIIQAPAHAGIGDGQWTRIVNVQYGECLTQVGGAPTDGTPIGHYPCDGSASQNWMIELVANNSYRLRSQSSNMCVDVHNNGTASGTIMVQHWCNTLEQQRFWLIAPDIGTYAFQSVWAFVKTKGLTRVIDVPPAFQDYRVRLWTYNATLPQQFTLQ